MTRITRATVDRSCAICERTLLMGERATRFSPNGGTDFVDVCPLCAETALEYGWLREGAPTTPTVAAGAAPAWQASLSSLLGARDRGRRRDGRVRADPPPALRAASSRWSRRPISSTRRSTGARSAASRSRSARRGSRSSSLSGVNAEVVVTVAWDISWYQYRVSPDSDNPVRLEERGHDPSELEGAFTAWNAHMDEDGRIVPDIARL